uniref:Ubiquitin-like domain-containing protein n=1 Tax=Oryza brachyantha TaxID=4533 RepID=J3NCL0_ORYBR
MEVTFERTKQQAFTLEIWYFSTVRQVKELVMQKTDIPVESQRLFLRGKELVDDDKGVQDYSVVEGSRILVVRRRPPAARRAET